MRILTLLLFWLFLVVDASAQVGVFVETTAKDSLGKRLDFVLRDELRSSSSFALTYDPESALIKISLLTLDPDEGSASFQRRTIYSFNILLRNPDGFDYFYTSFVGYCGADVLASCGKDIAQEIGVVLEDIRQALARTAVQKPASRSSTY